jgi:hypothetical protein
MDKDDLKKALPRAGGMMETPAGLLVSSRSIDSLNKAVAEESRKIAAEEEEKRGTLFSKYMLQNMSLYGAREKPQGTPGFRTLYQASRQSFIDAILIRARVDQMKRIWKHTYDAAKIGYKVVHVRHDDPDFKGSKEIDARCREMEALIDDPCPEKYNQFYPNRVRPHSRIKELVASLTKTELIIDRKCIRRMKRADGKGYAAFYALPGETVKNVDEAMKEWAAKNAKSNGGKKTINAATAYRMSEATGFDMTKSSYVQIVDGMLVDAFTSDELSIHLSNPSDEINTFGYGISRLEISLEVTATLMAAWSFNREMFKTNYPEAILSVAGDFDKEGLQAFKQMLIGDTHGAGNYWRLPVIPSGSVDGFKIEAHKLRDTPKDMLFNEFVRLLIMIKCAAYGAHPSTLNLQMDSGAGGSPLGNASPIDEIEFNKELSLIPSIEDMTSWLTDAIIKPRYDDLKLIVTGIEKDDEKLTVDLRSERVSKWITRNEARMEENREIIGELDDDSNPWNYPCDVPVPNYLNTFNMLSQTQGDPGDDQQDDSQDEDVQKSLPIDAAGNMLGPIPAKKSKKKSQPRDVKFITIEVGE